MQAHLLAAAMLLASTSVHAAEITASPVIVTATRTAQTADEALASVTIITREDIERRQAANVDDLLRGMPGISLSNNGGPGKVTSVFLRGAESDHVLVLVDGVKIGSATTGTAAFQDIPVDQIERIEIVRGPRSSLYGSEAIGGVIQIFTRKSCGATTPSLGLGAGSHNTYTGSAGVSGGGAQGWYTVNASGFSSEGFNACRGKPSPNGAGCFTYEPDNDGYRSRSGALRGGYRFDNGSEVEAHVLNTQARVSYDGTYVNESESAQQVAGGRVAFSPMTPWRLSLAAGRSRDDSDNFLNGSFKSQYNTTRDTATLQNDITLGSGHLLTLALDYQKDRIASTTAYATTERRDVGAFAQYQGVYGAQDVQVALRNDDNQQFGYDTTGGLAWGYNLNRDLRLVASYGSAFKAPTFNELYYPGFGNPSLRPEQSKSYELGLRGTTLQARWSLSAYETKINDLIGFDATYTPANIDLARIRGMEMSIDTKIAGWTLATGLTLLNPENRSSGASDGNLLPRRARETLRLDLDRSLGEFRFGGTLFAAGRRYDNLANSVELNSYATVDLRVDYTLAGSWTLGGRVGNLFDKHYETAAFYNQDGRNYFVTLRYRPVT
jgi:vitamin B12 transporter